MGYGNYEIVGGPLCGQFGGYNNEGPCGHPDCTEVVLRGTDAMCGDNPHGGDEDSCGQFFCDGHLSFAFRGPDEEGVGQRCMACADEIEQEDAERQALMAMQLRTETMAGE